MDYEEVKKILKERLKPDRYYHSLCVAEEAGRLAEKYGADSDKAYLAGLLHDITKNAPQEEHLQIFERFGIILTDLEKNSFKLWHAMSGAAYIRHILGIEDEALLTAVRYHTTGRQDMSLLEKVLYIADFTSADRNYDDVGVMRSLSDQSLDKAMAYALTYTIRELTGLAKPIHPDTVEAYNQVMLREELSQKARKTV